MSDVFDESDHTMRPTRHAWPLARYGSGAAGPAGESAPSRGVAKPVCQRENGDPAQYQRGIRSGEDRTLLPA